MQASCDELTLAPNNGPWLHETGILSLSPLPRDVQTFLQHVLQQEHWPTRPSQTMPCSQGTKRTSRQCSPRWRTTTGIGRPGILIPLFPHGMARKGHRAIHGPTQTDHRQPPPGIPRRRRQGGIPPCTNPPTHSEDTEATLHATGLLDPTQHRRHQRPELTIRIQQVQAPTSTATMGQPPGQKDLLLRLLPIQM